MSIKPWKSANGGHVEVRWGQLAGSQTFAPGSLVAMATATGLVTSYPADASEAILADLDYGFVGVAANGPGVIQAAATPAQTNIDWNTGVLYATNAQIAIYPANQGNLFITNRLLAAAGASFIAPVLADKGNAYQITALNATDDWGVEQTVGVMGTDVVAKVVDILDTNYVPLGWPGATATGVYVVFEITVS